MLRTLFGLAVLSVMLLAAPAAAECMDACQEDSEKCMSSCKSSSKCIEGCGKQLMRCSEPCTARMTKEIAKTGCVDEKGKSIKCASNHSKVVDGKTAGGQYRAMESKSNEAPHKKR